MDKEEKIAHINGRYLIISAVIGLLGVIITVYFYQPKENKIDEIKTELSTSEIKDIPTSKKSKNKDLDKPVIPKSNESSDVDVKKVVITIKDDHTKNPIPNIKIAINDYPSSLISDEDGNFIIPKSIIDKLRVYNSVKATFSKQGYQTEEQNVALSESHSLYIKKAK